MTNSPTTFHYKIFIPKHSHLLHNFTYEYNNSTYFLSQHKFTTNHDPFSTDSISSFSNATSTPIPIPITLIHILSFHDYILSTHKISNKSTISPTILPNTPPSQIQLNNNIPHNTPTPTTTATNTQFPITNVVSTYYSNSTQNDDSFLCSKMKW